MNKELFDIIILTNPWLDKKTDFTFHQFYLKKETYISRFQTFKLLLPEWDNLWLVLTGPRQAGKTTLGKHIAQALFL